MGVDEQVNEALEERAKVGRWISRHHDLNDRMWALLFDKWRAHEKVYEKDLAKVKWGRELLDSIPVAFDSYLRNMIYFD